MLPNKPAIRAERDKRVSAILNFAQCVPPRLSNNPQDHTVLPELQTHLTYFPIIIPPSRRGEFDAIGTDIWNLSTRLFRTADENFMSDKCTICLLRVFACLLLATANDTASGWQNGVRVLKVALKAARSCAKEVEVDWGTKMMERAAVYVAALEREKGTMGEERIVFERLGNEYLVMRVMLAWKQEKLAVADHMFQQIQIRKILEDTIAAEELSDVIYEIGRDEYLKKHFDVAVQWLERGVDLFGRQQLELLSDTAPDLKLSTLNLLVKSLIGIRTPEATKRAHSFMDLLNAEFGDKMVVSLLSLEVMATESKPDPGIYHGVLLQLFRSVHLSRPNFKTIMHHLHKLRNVDPIAACQALDDLLTIRLFENEKEEYIERAGVMRIWITTSLGDVGKIISSLTSFLDLLAKNLQAPITAAATNAVQTLIWKVIESSTTQKHYEAAEALCRLGNHHVLSNGGEGNKVKLSRKIIICALARNDLNAAREGFFSMPEPAQTNPQSRLLLYKIALRSQDLQLGEASESLEIIASASSKDVTLLYACILEARQLGQKEQAIQAMQKVLEKHKYNAAPGAHLPAMLRCLTKLIKSEIEETKSFKSDKLETYCRIFESAAAHITKSNMQQSTSDFNKDEVEWFARNSYNFALEYCSDLAPLHLARISSSGVLFLNVLGQVAAHEEITALRFRGILCEYLALTGYITAAREADHLDISSQYYATAINHSKCLRSMISLHIQSATARDTSTSALMSRHFKVVKYEIEANVRLKRFDELGPLLQECWRYDTDKKWDTLAGLAFVINEETQQGGNREHHQAGILSFIQEIIHRASSHNTSPINLARWLRCLFQISLPSNEHVASQCLDQALSLSTRLKETTEPFPNIELEWLATTTFNHAIDFYSAGNDAEARTWAEKAILLSNALDDDGSLTRLLQSKYSRLTWQDEEDETH